MPRLIDLTGLKFDKLTVLEKAPSRCRHVYWKCKCDCGRECEVSGESLRRKNQKHNCGICELNKTKKEEKKQYLVGQKFGKLLVLERLNKKGGNQGVFWKCQCDCGNIKEVPTRALTSGHTQSCGCLKLDSHLIDVTNQKFGKLTALYFIPKKGKWHCKCECGQECDVDSYALRHLIIQSCGCINYSIGEINIIKILNENNIIYKKEYIFENFKNPLTNRNYRYDFAIFKNEELIRLIEFDGEQHFLENRGTWDNKETLFDRQNRDNEKNQYAKENNVPLVRIPYWERDNITLDMILGDQYLIK